MTGVFASALDLPGDFFEAVTDHSIDTLRPNHYFTPDGAVVEAGQLGMGPHTDYGIVTVLWCDSAPGLQIVDADHLAAKPAGSRALTPNTNASRESARLPG